MQDKKATRRDEVTREKRSKTDGRDEQIRKEPRKPLAARDRYQHRIFKIQKPIRSKQRQQARDQQQARTLDSSAMPCRREAEWRGSKVPVWCSHGNAPQHYIMLAPLSPSACLAPPHSDGFLDHYNDTAAWL